MAIATEILLAQERLKNDLLLGESHFREFKSAIEGAERKRRRKVSSVAKDVGETLVAFANADGGTLIVGAEDDGSVSGIDYPADRLQVLLDAPETHVHSATPISGVKNQLVNTDGKTVLVYQVPKGTRYIHLTSDGRCVQRKDAETVPVASEQIHFERHEQLSREYDRQWVDGASILDLRSDLVGRIIKTVAPGLSAEKCLQTLGLAEFADGSLRLRKAALLLFATDVGKWHPRCDLRLQQIGGPELLTGADYNVIRDELYTGNVLELLSEGWEHVRQFLVQRKFAGGTFQFQATYPEDACREAFVNSIAHRDYSIEGRSIEVLVFTDRLEIRNPGRILSTVQLSELKQGLGVHDSRNTYVSRVLRELGYMQEMGEGIRRINALMNGHELAPPEIQSADHSFLISFSQRNIFNPIEQRWLDAFSVFNLSREEKLIVILGRGGNRISPTQIWEALDLVDTEDYRQIIERLSTKGLLMSTMPGSAATQIARKQRIPRRDVPRFVIRAPEHAEHDQSEVVDALVRIGPLTQIKPSHFEVIRDMVSDQNIYRGPVKIRSLLQWLEMTEPGGYPTDRLRDLWSKDDERKVRPGVAELAEQTERVTPALTPVRDIYVGNLDHRATELELHELFRRFGPVVSVTMPKDYLTDNNRGYAFVRMADSNVSLNALNDLNGQLLRNRPLKLGWSFR